MRVLLGLSGGLDSSFAAYRLRSEGYDVTAAALLMHDYFDVSEAESSARMLGIPFVTVDCRERFERVKDNFAAEYSLGRTPNPCVICNAEVKLACLYDYARREGFDYIATGHYASVLRKDGKIILAKSKDKHKDQSYMLYRVEERILEKLLLPLSDITKSEVREFMRDEGLEVLDRAESQEICFIPSGDYPAFVENRLARTFGEGDFLGEDGAPLGRHKGIIRYTVGQRKGLGVSAKGRLFVKEINPIDSSIILSESQPKAVGAMLYGFVSLSSSGIRDGEEYALSAVVRYRAKPVECRLRLMNGGEAEVRFAEEVPFVCPGQSIVLYDGEKVVGGGFVRSAIDARLV